MGSAPNPLATAIRRRRRELVLTQSQVARAAGKTQAQVSDLERGTEDLRLSTVLQIVRSVEADLFIVPNSHAPAVLAILSGRNYPEGGRLVGNDPEDATGDSDV